MQFSKVTKGQGHLQLHAAVKYVQNYMKCMHTSKVKPLFSFDYDAIFSQPKTIFREQATRILKEKRKMFFFSLFSIEGEFRGYRQYKA